MDTLDDNYGVVDHYRNGKHHGRKGQQVDTKADQLQYEECRNQCYRNSNSGDQCGTEILQEDIYHNEHKDKGLDQCLDNLMDRGEQEVVGTLCNVDLQARR